MPEPTEKIEPIVADVTTPDIGALVRILLEKVIPGSKWNVKYTVPGPLTKPEQVAWRIEATRK